MERSTISQNKKNIVKITAATIFWIGIWYAAALLVGRELLVPYPHRVVARIGELAVTGGFWIRTGLTFVRVLSGFAAGVVTGTVLAALAAVSGMAEAVISPLVRILRATPVASFIMLVMLWIGYSFVPVFIAAMTVAPVVYMNVLKGIENTDAGLLEMAQVYGIGTVNTIRAIYIPSVKPYFSAALVTGLGLAWKSGVAAEVLARPVHSIGGEIYFSKIYIETTDLFAWTIVVVLLSLALEKLIAGRIRR